LYALLFEGSILSSVNNQIVFYCALFIETKKIKRWKLNWTTSCVICMGEDLILSFFCYHDIGTKFSPPLAMINLRRKTCGTHKVGSLIPNEFSLYAWARNRTSGHMLKGTKSLTIWNNSLLISYLDLITSYLCNRGQCLFCECKKREIYTNI
jgi:hypothetical protein